jgi:hypothetical protein
VKYHGIKIYLKNEGKLSKTSTILGWVPVGGRRVKREGKGCDYDL